MTTYTVHFQVKNSYVGEYPEYQNEYGTKFVTVSVKAESQKEAWSKAQKQSGLTIVCKIEEFKAKKQTKTFQEKLDATYKSPELLKNRHQYAMELVTLMTSRKANRERVDGYQVKKNKNGYSILFNGMDIGLNNMSANTAYGWCVRNPLNHWVRFAENVRNEYYDQYAA